MHLQMHLAQDMGPARAKQIEKKKKTIVPIEHCSILMAESSVVRHPTGGRRKKAKGPPAQPALPDLPPLPGGSDSSDGLDEEEEAKKLRSTSTTPRSNSARGLEPFEYDGLMGINSVGPSSEGFDDWEATNEEANRPNKPLTSSTPRSGLDSGVGKSSRGFGSASLLEVLNTQRAAHLEFPATCTSQGATERLRIEQKPQQVESSSSSSNLYQGFFGVDEAHLSTKVGDDANAKDETDQKQEDGDHTPSPASRTEVPKPEVPYQEDPYGLPPGVKKEDESTEGGLEGLQRDQPLEYFQEAREYVAATARPMRRKASAQPHHSAESLRDSDE